MSIFLLQGDVRSRQISPEKPQGEWPITVTILLQSLACLWNPIEKHCHILMSLEPEPG